MHGMTVVPAHQLIIIYDLPNMQLARMYKHSQNVIKAG